MKQVEISTSSLEKYVRRNRVFILGAGFSAGAGIPLTEELLVRTARKFARECPGLFARVEGYAKESIATSDKSIDFSKLSFSELCTFLEFIELREYGGGERWCENGSREKLALRFYLAKTLVECTPVGTAIPQIYLGNR